MGAYVFNNQIFDSWLNKKTDDIMSKVDRETISTEEMIILVLKAQTNHFHHMDDEFRGEFSKIDKRFEAVDKKFDAVDKKFDAVDKKFEAVDKKLESMDKKIDTKFEKLEDKFRSTMMWQTGLMLTLFAGLYLKLYFP